MTLQISQLRRWFAAGAFGLLLLVAVVYFYARPKLQNGLREVPARIGLEVQQSAQGFTISRSEAGHTLFKIQASKAVQFKRGGRAELHDVTITVYGRDSSRFDQIYGTDFEYDPQSGDVIGKGEVQMDLEANPEGLTHPDQAPPNQLKNPVHLRMTNLVFNQKTGNASTGEKIEFSVPQAEGSAVGLSYVANTTLLTLQSKVAIDFHGSVSTKVTAVRGTMTKNPRIVELDFLRLQNPSRRASADKGTVFLRPDNTVERILALGNVQVESESPTLQKVQSDQLDLRMDAGQNALRAATFSGHVRLESAATQPLEANAGRVLLNFAGNNVLTTIHSEQNVKLTQHPQRTSSASGSGQELEVTAPVIDFALAGGRRLDHAETSAAAQIAVMPVGPGLGPRTVVTAGKFQARFDPSGQLASLHGAPNVRIVSQTPNQPDRVSTSATLDAFFHPGRGMESILQQGDVAYQDGDRRAWGERASYTPADQMLLLSGSPRVVDGGMTSTGQTMHLNRASGEVLVDGYVKSTYSDLRAQPDGALLASSSPIHVTARAMIAHNNPAVAVYSGDARLWQDANLIQAPSIEFDRNHRSVLARGSVTRPVSTMLVQAEKSGKVTPVKITSSRLSYADTERRAHLEGAVQAQGADLGIVADAMDVFLQPRDQVQNQALAGPGRIDHVVASEHVVITQPGRKATGDRLVYTASDDKFVLSGGSPSIFDAEQGKITGVSLTLFRHDDRVLVEGNNTSPTVTQTRVAR